MYVLGIDGGGTKTTGVIANANGDVLYKATVGGSNLNSTAKSLVANELAKLITLLKQGNPTVFSEVKHAFAGIAGAAHVKTKMEMENLITSLIPSKVRVTVDHDAITALYSGTLGQPGIVQIAGTGAITFGINQNGDQGRVGGWGHLFSDHGSGYAIGRDGLKSAFLAYDGLEAHTYIQELLLVHFQVTELPEIIRSIYQGNNPKEIIASLSKLVVTAADHGDLIAQKIIKSNGILLGESIACLAKQLFTKEAYIPVVLAGGLFNRLDLFKESIVGILENENINNKIMIPKALPVAGAVIAGFQAENIKVQDDFTIRFQDSMGPYTLE